MEPASLRAPLDQGLAPGPASGCESIFALAHQLREGAEHGHSDKGRSAEGTVSEGPAVAGFGAGGWMGALNGALCVCCARCDCC